jgi:ribosomal protein S18 acetylase RimI-like enzyme
MPIEASETSTGDLTDTIQIHAVHARDAFPEWTSTKDLAKFLHQSLQPYADTLPDIQQGIEDAFRSLKGKSGFIVLAEEEQRLIGAVVMLRTGMGGYVPEYLLLFVAVDASARGNGVGRRLVEQALALADGDVKLHVEHDNPAKRLYERLGFTNEYAEMRFSK